MIAGFRRHELGAWHLAPAAEVDGVIVPTGSTLCGMWLPAGDVVAVVEPGLVDELLAGVECCKPCRTLGQS